MEYIKTILFNLLGFLKPISLHWLKTSFDVAFSGWVLTGLASYWEYIEIPARLMNYGGLMIGGLYLLSLVKWR